MYADLRRQNIVRMKIWIASIFIGAGGFQMFDGIINHKLLRIHQVRYGVDVLPYDLAWNIAGAVLIITGSVILIHEKRQAAYRRMEE